MILILIINFAANYFRRKEEIYNELILMTGLSLIVVNYMILYFIGLLRENITKQFLKKALVILIIQIYLFFHRFYFKGEAMFVILEQFLIVFGKNYGLNIFKMFLMLFYIFYDILSGKMLLFLFRKTLTDPKLSYNIGIFMIKFVSVDILSIDAFNAVTISLDEVYSWISFTWYLYSVFSCYTRTNAIVTIFKKILGKILTKKKKYSQEKILDEDEKRFNELRSGCIFETNLIVFLRIISFKILPCFLFFTPQKFLYQNCALEEKFDHFQILDTNVIVLMVLHTSLLGVLGIIVYGFGKEQYLLITMWNTSTFLEDSCFLLHFSRTRIIRYRFIKVSIIFK